MPDFNLDQSEAIRALNQKILVSAAAGSGKTTVMVEKIRETLIRHPEASVSQFLVITFTRDAAQNMKDKLRDLLEKAAGEGSEPAARALSEIEAATISTIHSFCTQLLKEYNDNAGASMNPRVLKDAEKKHIMEECFSDAAEQIFTRRDRFTREDRQAVGCLMTAFSPEETGKMVEDLYNVLMGIPDPFDFLGRIVSAPPVELWNREIMISVDLDVLGLEECLRREEELLQEPWALPSCGETARADAELVRDFREAYERAEGTEEKRALLQSAAGGFARAPSAPRGSDEETKAWKKRFDDVRNEMKGTKGIFAAAVRRIDAMLDEKNDRRNAVIRRELRGLELLLRETAAQYEQQKLEAGAIDYADMEQIAYRIMSDPDKRNELLARYRYIYVDECQDVSGIQDAIIQSLAGPGHQFFMVGDIKQSIYGFRHAEPDLFEGKRKSYLEDAEAEERRIFFRDNYRSCRSVVDAVNEVFTGAMDERITDMNYLPEDHLRCNVPGDFGPVDVLLVQKGEEDADKLEAQCEAAGRYIRSLITPAAETGGRENYRYRDIVILLRTAKGVASAVTDHLKKMHIPALYEGNPDFFGLSEVKSFLCLLTVIDNLHHDDALVGTLINPPFLFTETELAEIRLAKNEVVPFYEAFELCAERNETPADRRCRQAANRLEAWRKISETMQVPDFIWWLMRETGIYAARGAYPDGKARQANLDSLYQRALDGQKAGDMRLSDFIGRLREARETRQSDSDDHPAMGAGDDFVRIMTMHKSKGLEFPVVILMDLQKSIRRKRSDEKLRMNVASSGGALGLYLPAVRRGKNSAVDSQGKEAFDIRARRKNISEGTRLLYVAMTRARQKLCLIGSYKEGEEELWNNRTRAARIWKTDSMLDMIMPAVLRRVRLPELDETAEDALWRLSRVSGRTITEAEEAADTVDERIAEVLRREELSLLFTPETAKPAPLKTSVTTLAHHDHPLSGEESGETLEDKRKPAEAVRTFRLSSVPSRPAFLEEEQEIRNAADIGTATHRFLHLINLEALRQEGADAAQTVRAEMERMRAEQILTREEAEMIRLGGVVSFFTGDLGRRMLRSPEVKREAPFSMRISPHSSTVVQGIIDCVFREGDGWILVDYKTDRDTAPETFVPRHEMQMNWYRVALERLTRVPVREMWLFALSAGRAYPVERREIG
ncbi:MAG: UvrD-helicase domain-containing protein [Clostridia bacterium]|nr:UvrD-helicase domain-containing protein [Clostridia bacterium]